MVFFQTILFLYLELVLIISTTGIREVRSLVIMALFALSEGFLAELLLRLIKSVKTRVFIRTCLLFAISFIYSLEFFIYRSFNVFYDVNTIVNGAGGVVGGFMGDALRLVLSVDGIFHLLMFFLPPVLYLIVLRKKESRIQGCKLILLVAFLALFILGRVFVFVSPTHSLMYGTEYNFQSVVENMGFGVGL